jgi:hypothetical protein
MPVIASGGTGVGKEMGVEWSVAISRQDMGLSMGIAYSRKELSLRAEQLMLARNEPRMERGNL